MRRWAKTHRAKLIEVEVETASKGWMPALALPDIEARMATAPAPTSRLRILNPFDPLIRDRTRLARLFGFDYRIEIFVPVAKRKWGYYVFPLLEGDRFVGRLEVRADRRAGLLSIENIWYEQGVRWSKRRYQKLDAELERLGRFVDAGNITWSRTTDTLAY